ncbi:MAG TPA: 7-cyano-7-deazaguanine synthase QueC [Planctomycetaceae bacterium]|nr:7-cyano-7-deazaguanine synthase QueC [Planctomycetaceae bacterium]
MTKPAVVLLSGGLDSATTAAVAKDAGFDLFALTVDYGQRHKFELSAAARVATSLDIRHHKVVRVDLSVFGGSALTDAIAVPKDRSAERIGSGIPITYVPARNTVFLALALAYAETVGAADLFLGVNAVDYSGYPDCRPEFLAKFAELATLATKAGVEGTLQFRIHAPLVDLTKADIIRRGMALGVDYGLTHTCYDPDQHGTSCGHCDACQLRRRGFAEAGYEDPVAYSRD